MQHVLVSSYHYYNSIKMYTMDQTESAIDLIYFVPPNLLLKLLLLVLVSGCALSAVNLVSATMPPLSPTALCKASRSHLQSNTHFQHS